MRGRKFAGSRGPPRCGVRPLRGLQEVPGSAEAARTCANLRTREPLVILPVVRGRHLLHQDDFVAVDAQGRRCPTDEARVDFKVDGPLVWRGGFNAGKLETTNNLYLDTECGINRVAVRSTMTPGTITVTATRAGLEPATLKIESKPVAIEGGLTREMPQTLARVAMAAPRR